MKFGFGTLVFCSFVTVSGLATAQEIHNAGGFHFGPESAQVVQQGLPTCAPVPGSQFSEVYNLFDSAVTGSQTLKAKTSCASLKIQAGAFYDLLAETRNFQIFDDSSFFTPNPVARIQIAVPAEGDYVTADTCSDPSISSDDIRSPSQELRIFQNGHDGSITIEHATERCELKICPKFGICE